MRNLLHSRSPLRIKAAEIGADGTFSGYGSVFNVVDSGGDMVAPGAFSASLKRHAAEGTRPKLLWQHCHDDPIGTWLEMKEDDHGLWCRGQLLLDLSQAREAYVLMKAGELDGLSIGYETLDWEMARSDDLGAKFGVYGPPGSYAMPGNGQVRVLKQLDLWEVSPVTFPMNTAARVDDVKRAAQHAAGGAGGHDLSPILAALERRERVLA